MFEAKLFPDGSAAPPYAQRWFQRLPIAVQLELLSRDNSFPIRLKTADISIGGCYGGMGVAIEPGTNPDVIPWPEHEGLPLAGRVTTNHPHFGDGIGFIGVTPEAETQLRSFLEKAQHSRVI